MYVLLPFERRGWPPPRPGAGARLPFLVCSELGTHNSQISLSMVSVATNTVRTQQRSRSSQMTTMRAAIRLGRRTACWDNLPRRARSASSSFPFASGRPGRVDHVSQFTANATNATKGAGAERKGAGEMKQKSSNTTQQKIDTNPPRGTRDFFPDDKRLQGWLFNEFAQVSTSFGFEQIDFPVLESEELFVRKAGEEITDQLYNFEDKGGRRVSLRPELTPSLARLALQKGKGLALPAKWFAIG